MLSRQIEMADKLEVHENEKRLREQGSTFLAHTHNDVGGRFAAISSPVVVGERQIPNYPQGPAWCAADQELEPPLGVDLNAIEPVGEKFEVELSREVVRPLEPFTPLAAKAPPGHSSISSFVQATPSSASDAKAPPLANAELGFSPKTFRRF